MAYFLCQNFGAILVLFKSDEWGCKNIKKKNVTFCVFRTTENLHTLFVKFMCVFYIWRRTCSLNTHLNVHVDISHARILTFLNKSSRGRKTYWRGFTGGVYRLNPDIESYCAVAVYQLLKIILHATNDIALNSSRAKWHRWIATQAVEQNSSFSFLKIMFVWQIWVSYVMQTASRCCQIVIVHPGKKNLTVLLNIYVK